MNERKRKGRGKGAKDKSDGYTEEGEDQEGKRTPSQAKTGERGQLFRHSGRRRVRRGKGRGTRGPPSYLLLNTQRISISRREV